MQGGWVKETPEAVWIRNEWRPVPVTEAVGNRRLWMFVDRAGVIQCWLA
jgi:hypothetical protein